MDLENGIAYREHTSWIRVVLELWLRDLIRRAIVWSVVSLVTADVGTRHILWSFWTYVSCRLAAMVGGAGQISRSQEKDRCY